MHGRCDVSTLHTLLADAGRMGVLRWVARGRLRDGFALKLLLAAAIVAAAGVVRRFGGERL